MLWDFQDRSFRGLQEAWNTPSWAPATMFGEAQAMGISTGEMRPSEMVNCVNLTGSWGAQIVAHTLFWIFP